MTGNLSDLTPLIVLGVTPLVLMLLIAWRRSHLMTAVLSLVGLALTLALVPGTALNESHAVTPLLVMDGYALFYIGLLAAGTFVVVVLSYGYMERQPGHREEFYLLLTLATFGCAVLAASNHFASFFLGLEILSMSTRGVTPLVLMLLIAWRRSHLMTAVLSLVGLALTLALVPGTALNESHAVTPLLVMDGYALFYIGLLAAGTFVVVVLSYGYMERQPGHREEFYLLLTLATFGCAVLAASNAISFHAKIPNKTNPIWLMLV